LHSVGVRVAKIQQQIAEELGVREQQVDAAVELLDGGATVPFIARYRKELTGALDDAQLRTLEERLTYLRELDERRTAVLNSIREQGKLDAALEASILAADTKGRLEDIYAPFKPKRRTKAEIAKEAGLEPLSELLLTQPQNAPEAVAAGFVDADKGVADITAALEGARAVLTERFDEDADLKGALREEMWSQGRMASSVRNGKKTEGEKFKDYFDFSEPLHRLPSHRILAMFRGEKEEILNLQIQPEAQPSAPGVFNAYELKIMKRFDISRQGRAGDAWLAETVRWAWRTKAMLGKLAITHRVDLIAIGNGTASRETDKLATELVKRLPDLKMTKIVVSEAGASVYSASAFASEELPELDVTMRGAVSIARRLQDPLAELVKIDPKAIGVGQYQHDLGESHLARSLDAVVEDCVNAVGVDVNTASAPLLTRVSGIGPGLAQSIVEHRNANGVFKSRKALKDVPRLGAKAFEQCAGFLRINGGDDPLDASAVHPESYPVVRRILAATKSDIKALIGNSEVVRQLKAQAFVDGTFGLPTVTDILRELEKPGRDPRPAFKAAVFKEGVEEIKHLKPGMILEGTVTNVAAFGAFVDIGVHQDGLVHISAMSKTFIKDPREVVKPGDIVKVKVLEVEVARKRIALTLRLDDEVGSKKESKGTSRDASRTSSKAAPPRKPAPQSSGGGALADALRRASEKGDRGKTRP
jgi:competence ComEA-like helix-hairpin-helix protein